MNKPVKPKRKKGKFIFKENQNTGEFYSNIDYNNRISNCEKENFTLADIIKWANNEGFSSDQIYFYLEASPDKYDFCSIDSSLNIFFEGEEPEEEFNSRKEIYNKKLKDYKKWFEKNKEEIKNKEKTKKEKTAAKKEEARLLKIEKLRKELIELEFKKPAK